MTDENNKTGEQQKVTELEAQAERIREDVARAKAAGVQEGSAEAERIRKEVRDIEIEANKLSPAAFGDLKQHEQKVEIVE